MTERRDTGRRLAVDWRLCAGHGVCSAAAPELIRRDRWGYPDLGGVDGVEVPDDLVPAARWASASCPAAALRLRRTVPGGAPQR